MVFEFTLGFSYLLSTGSCLLTPVASCGRLPLGNVTHFQWSGRQSQLQVHTVSNKLGCFPVSTRKRFANLRVSWRPGT